MWNYLKGKLGISKIGDDIDRIESKLNKVPGLEARHRQVLTAIETVLHVLESPTSDDSLVMHHLRCMGYCGGWKAKNGNQSNVDQPGVDK